jgi:hypothetical protein
MRTPATWPLHTARRAPPTETRPATTPPETILASPPPEAPSDAPPPLGPTKSLQREIRSRGDRPLRPNPRSTRLPLIAQPVGASPPNPPSSSSPNPPSLEAILAASSDEPTDARGRITPKFLIAGPASLGVLVPCLVGAAFMMLSPGAPPLRCCLWDEQIRGRPPPRPRSPPLAGIVSRRKSPALGVRGALAPTRQPPKAHGFAPGATGDPASPRACGRAAKSTRRK